MAITKERIEEHDKLFKDLIFNKIDEAINGEKEVIAKEVEYYASLGLPRADIPCIGISLNNKIVELLWIFKHAGISLFSSPRERYDYVSTSFIGDAIIDDLISKYGQAIERFNEHYNEMTELVNKRNQRLLAEKEKISSSKHSGFFQRLYNSISKKASTGKEDVVLLTSEERKVLDDFLREYNAFDSEIRSYNLENNLIPALVTKIAEPEFFGHGHHFSASTVPRLLEEECVIPYLDKLGLRHLIPKLQEALIKEYEKDLVDNGYQINLESINSYPPDITAKEKNTESTSEDSATVDYTEMRERIRQETKETLISGIIMKLIAGGKFMCDSSQNLMSEVDRVKEKLEEKDTDELKAMFESYEDYLDEILSQDSYTS